jgi:hypothetical protein
VVAYQFKWAAEGSWKSGRLEPHSTACHSHPLAEGKGALPAFEVKFKDEDKVSRLAAKQWKGSPPPDRDAGKKYVIRKKKGTRGLDTDPADDSDRPPAGDGVEKGAPDGSPPTTGRTDPDG